MAQNAGITSTKSATWIRSFYEGLLPDGKQGSAHDAALSRLGLGKPADWQVRDKSGAIDWGSSTDKAAAAMQERMSGMDEAAKAATLKSAFGERGGGIAALLTQQSTRDQFDGIRKKIGAGGNLDLFREYSENSGLMQGQRAWRDLQNVMIDLGMTVLPAVTAGFRAIDTIIKQFPADWDASVKQWREFVSNPFGLAHGDPSNKPQTPAEKNRDLQSGGAAKRDETNRDRQEAPADQPSSWMDRVKGWAGLRHQTADVQWDNASSGDGLGMRSALTIWAQQALTLDQIRTSISGPAVEKLTAIDADLQVLGSGIAAAISGGMAGGTGGGITKASWEDGSIGSSVDKAAGTFTTGGATYALAPPGAQSGVVDRASAQLGANSRQAARALGKRMTPGEWCADFVGGILEHAGIKSTGSSAAASYRRWGQHVASLAGVRKGDVIVENHHVGIATGMRDKLGRLGMISGNYGHKVSPSWERPGRILDLRRAAPDAGDIADKVSGARSGATHHHHGPVTIAVNGPADPRQITDMVMAQFSRAMQGRTSDVDFDVT